MYNNRDIQQELFEDFAQPARQRKRLLKAEDIKKTYRISLEQVIFVSIGFIILLVVSFSLGVESGKRLPAKSQSEGLTMLPAAAPASVEDGALLLTEEEKHAEAKKKAAPEPKPISAKKDTSLYVIQLATYSGSETAEKEKKSVEAKGFSMRLVNTGRYYILYVVGFANKQQAQNSLKKLKSSHKDCFVRKMDNIKYD